MYSSTANAQARSTLYRLLALGFSHPTPELFAAMESGAFQAQLKDCMEALEASSSELPVAETSFADFEALYIDLFLFGQNGRPHVPLHAGDFDEILQGRSRPEFMLEYSKWYRHFGLRTRDDPAATELPDHLTCQLEFLSWLAHLEANADPESPICIGYRKAQHDFAERMALPFMGSVAKRLSGKVGACEADPIFSALAQTTLSAINHNLHRLASKADASRPQQPDPAAYGANP